MKKKTKVIILILVIIFMVKAYITRNPTWGEEYYILDLEKSKIELTEDEKNSLVKMLGLNDDYFIEFTKIAYEGWFQNEGDCYIFLKTNNIHDEEIREVYRHICMNTDGCENFKIINKIVRKYYYDSYKWWKIKPKTIEIEEDKIDTIIKFGED